MSAGISIKHMLNHRVKPVVFSGQSYYPLDVSITISGKKARFRSKLSEHLKIYRSNIDRITKGNKQLALLINSGLFTKKDFELLLKEKRFPIYHLIKDETNVLERVVQLRISGDSKKITLAGIHHDYENCTREITDILDDYLREKYQEELKAIFLKSIDDEEHKEIFNIANYFVHLINWNHSFYYFYDSTFDIMPSELKKIENLLSRDLRTVIKAYMAFHAFINPLKRLFEKRELGKISTLSFLDWESDIKAMLLKQYEKLYGHITAKNYIGKLDDILHEMVLLKGK